jgi:hypothetical protein
MVSRKSKKLNRQDRPEDAERKKGSRILFRALSKPLLPFCDLGVLAVQFLAFFLRLTTILESIMSVLFYRLPATRYE